MPERRIVIDYTPRHQFQAFHDRAQRWAVIVAHRRAGKTVATINDIIRRAITDGKPEARYAYIAPLFNQAKDIAWLYLKRYAAPLLADSPNETELRVDLVNGARIRLYGADNPDRLRGIYLNGVVLDEYANMHAALWLEVIRPALTDRLGWATFIGTPAGKNIFWDLWQAARKSDDWFTLELKASETGLLPQAELDNSYRAMGEDRYAQEMECSFDAAIQGAYYAKLLDVAQKQGRICRLAADPLLPVRAFFDLGGAGASADAMSIWIGQWLGADIRMLDYIEGKGQVLAYYTDELRRRGYGEAICYLPHDGLNTNNITGKRYAEHLRDAGFDVPQPTANQGKGAAMMRIEAARRLFPRIWFDQEKTQAGRDALAYYHERKDEERGIGLGPEHDWCLAAGTQVLTPSGWEPIENLSVHNYVLSPIGARRVLRSGVVRVTDKWTKVKGIRCTPEHRFFTSRGLVEAGMLTSKDEFWTRGGLGLRILAFLCAILCFGLKAGITSATREARVSKSGAQSSFIVWCMRLFMARFRQSMKFITLMITHSTIIQTICRLFPSSYIAVGISQSLDFPAFVEFVGNNSDAISNLARGAVWNASGSITLEPNANAEPAYSLTIDRDECYFVRGSDGRAYLVSNSSHCADAFGLMCVVYEEPRVAMPARRARAMAGSWMGN